MENIPCADSKTLYYDIPTQVKFFDFGSEEPYWIGGIAFQDVIICGCCGFGDLSAPCGKSLCPAP